MHILITGNLGYLGPVTSEMLKAQYSNARITGIDLGLFYPFPFQAVPGIDRQLYKDIRSITADDLNGIDVVIHLAAISNDPMGNQFEVLTESINEKGSLMLAKLAKKMGVARFIFASSCSVYGSAGQNARIESDPTAPITAYARSKVKVEDELNKLSSSEFQVVAFRFATACGWSPNLRLDLVLNDFIASALTTKTIDILSDGKPWRPLIDVSDMSALIIMAVSYKFLDKETYLCINAGFDDHNFQVREIAGIISDAVPGVAVTVNENASPDARSYRVSFEKCVSFLNGAFRFKPIEETVQEMVQKLSGCKELMGDFRNSNFIRLNVLRKKIGVDLSLKES